MSKTQLQTNNAKLEALITELQGKAAGGGGGLETCDVTIVQEWGGNDDPVLLTLYATGYNIADGVISPFYTKMTSQNDLAPQHSVNVTAYKNVPFTVLCHSGYGNAYAISATANGGTISDPVSDLFGTSVYYMHTLIPTADEATFTFASP